ncbi:MAG: DUF5107 domain-containing protein [Clostridiales bacterium]|jgi:tetratricopeptide (TPR) repeat protein|nr:DUF5107 domain-containing protein [Clostridiales bacterium]
MRTSLTFGAITMPGADLGPENPLPDIRAAQDFRVPSATLDESIPEDERPLFSYGKISSVLPYRIQDGYNREKTEKSFPCATLENERVKAVFIPSFGGRLWSLLDKERGRELLHANPVFQPANLALRNAWISGGVEWNVGIAGHSPFTLSQLHVARAALSDGTPVLRMYEWERIRRASYQIDAFLPEGSRFLYVRVRIKNTRGEETPMYWWSNAAVDETPGTRVLTRADAAYSYGYDRTVRLVPVPVNDGIDKSYSARGPHSQDFFYDIPAGGRKWEAALDESGEGIAQASTDRLIGRKLFMWGNGAGGRRWQSFLSVPGSAYCEIQAGLAHTQMQHVPMPAGAAWEWLEAYGYMRADPKKAHGADWREAYTHVERRLSEILPREALERAFADSGEALAAPASPMAHGSGWAALELLRQGKRDRFDGEAAVFSEESMTGDQAPWLELLRSGTFPDQPAGDEPAAYMAQAEWLPLLEKAARGGSDHWHAWLQLGVMRAAAGELDKAKKAFETSDARTPNGWAKRNLAVLAQIAGDREEAADKLLEAADLLPIRPMAVECGKALLDAGRLAEFARFYGRLPHALREHGRLRAMRAQAAVMADDFDTGLAILEGGIQMADLREGELALSDLWVLLHARKIAKAEGLAVSDELKARALREHPIPAALDFRMRA